MENGMTESPTSTEMASENQIDVQPTPTKPPEIVKITNVMIPKQELVYRNETLGYQITFSENWRGHYLVTEYSSGNVCIGFYGKSKTGRMGEKDITGRDGLDMFYIETKQSNPDVSVYQYKIGEVNGIEYFYRRGYSSILFDILEPDGWRKDYVDRELYEIDEEELRLVEQDAERFMQIVQEDLWNAEEVIFPTFKAIE